MASSSIYLTPKRKSRSIISSSSSTEVSPDEKRLKSTISPSASYKANSDDEVMAALSLTESLTKKLDLILARQTMTNERLMKLDEKMDELNQTVKGLQTKISYIETDVVAVKGKQKSLEEDCFHMKENAKFIEEKIAELQESANKRKADINEYRKQILYLEAYSCREILKCEGIPESFETSAQHSAHAEDTRKVLVNFIEDTLGIEDAKGIEFQRVHRMGKPRSGSGNGSRTIITRFLRYSDSEHVFKCGRKLKDTYFKMFENIPKELHELRKMQIDKLKKARKDRKHAYFSKSEPDKLFIDGKYVHF